MTRFAYVLVVIVVEALSRCAFAADSPQTLEATPDKAALQERITKVEAEIKRLQRGQVVIGQVVLEGKDNVESVMAQMLILKGGYFATAVVDFSRPLTFRLHQYAPLDLDLEQRVGDQKGDIIDIGVVKMRRLVPADLLSVEGKVTLEGSDNPTQATVKLSMSQGPANSPTNGTEPRPNWAAPIEIRVDETGSFRSDSFSPMTYYCQIMAKGYVTKGFPVELNPRERNNLGTFTLEKPRRVELEYIISKDGPFELENVKKTTLSGGAHWKAAPDIYGWDLEFVQKNGKLYFNANYQPCFLEDLGVAELKEFLDARNVIVQEFPRDLAVEDGHVYLVNQEHWKRNILFRAKLKPIE